MCAADEERRQRLATSAAAVQRHDDRRKEKGAERMVAVTSRGQALRLARRQLPVDTSHDAGDDTRWAYKELIDCAIIICKVTERICSHLNYNKVSLLICLCHDPFKDQDWGIS